MQRWLVAALASGILTGSAYAEDMTRFRLTDNSVRCSIMRDVFQGEVDVTTICQLMVAERLLPSLPQTCPGEERLIFVLLQDDEPQARCESLIPFKIEPSPLTEKERVRVEGTICVAIADAMRCTNVEGHGFVMGRGKQELF